MSLLAILAWWFGVGSVLGLFLMFIERDNCAPYYSVGELLKSIAITIVFCGVLGLLMIPYGFLMIIQYNRK